jgi:YVTN family beta-propeller protein
MNLKNSQSRRLPLFGIIVFCSILFVSSYGSALSHTYSNRPVVNYLGQALVSRVVANVSSPVALLFSPERGDILVASPSTDKIFILEHSTYQVVSNISLPYSPIALSWDAIDGNYYAIGLPGSVESLDGDELDLRGSASITSPIALSYDGTHDIMYVLSNTTNTVYVLSALTAEIVRTINVCCTPTSLAYDSVNGYLYVAESGANTVDVINPTNGSTIANITVGSDPKDILDNGPYLYVADYNSNNVSVIDGLTENVTQTIAVGSEPDSIAYNSFNGCYYVANYGSADVSEICEGSVSTTFTVGSGPDYVLYDPTEWLIIVANYGSNSISEISTPNAPSLPTSSTSETTTSIQTMTSSSSNSSTNITSSLSSTTSSINSSSTTQDDSNGFPTGYIALISIAVIALSECGILVYFIRRSSV